MSESKFAKIIERVPEKVEFKRNESGKYVLEFDELPLLLFVSSEGTGNHDQLFVNGTESITHSAVTIESEVNECTTYTLRKYAVAGEYEKETLIVAKRLNEKQLAAVEYLAQPNRAGLTNDQIAEAVGVDRATFYRWKQDDAFQQAVQKAVIRNVHDRLGDLYDAAIDAVVDDKNAAMFRTILQSAGMLTEKVEVDSKQSSGNIDALKAEIERFRSKDDK